MTTLDIVLLLLVVVCGIAVFARRLSFSYPVAFMLGGMALAWLPGFPEFHVPPEMMLTLFLPPLLTEAAYFTSLRDFRANLRPILQLAIGLVVISCVTVGLAAWWAIPGLTLAAAFALGAIVSPPDAVAAGAVLKQLRVPRRVMQILEGESLINDASGLVLYQFAVAAAVVGGFSAGEASLQFLWMAVSGIAIGIAAGWTLMYLFPRIKEQSVEILATFLVPYAVYILAEHMHSSGVLAVVANGLTVGWLAPMRFSPSLRIPLEAVWKMAVFVLNGLVFLLIGLEFPGLLSRLHGYTPQELLFYACVVSGVAIAVRFIWMYVVGYGVRFLFPSIRARDPYPPWQNMFILGWTGMRGVVSLATALALPLYTLDGTAFPSRDLIIFLAFSVIVVTLVAQGLSLPWLLRHLPIAYETQGLHEEWSARKEAVESALTRLDGMRASMTDQPAALERILSHYQDRLTSLGDGPNTPLNPREAPTASNHPLIETEHRIWRDVLDAERKAVICMRQTYAISDDVMHDLLREIDLMHNRFKAA